MFEDAYSLMRSLLIDGGEIVADKTYYRIVPSEDCRRFVFLNKNRNKQITDILADKKLIQIRYDNIVLVDIASDEAIHYCFTYIDPITKNEETITSLPLFIGTKADAINILAESYRLFKFSLNHGGSNKYEFYALSNEELTSTMMGNAIHRDVAYAVLILSIYIAFYLGVFDDMIYSNGIYYWRHPQERDLVINKKFLYDPLKNDYIWKSF